MRKRGRPPQRPRCTLHLRLETETLGEGPRRTLTGWKRSYQPHLDRRGYSSAFDKAWESLRRTGNATRKPGKGAALRPVRDRLGSQGGWESGGRGANARWCLQQPMGGRQNADTPQASKGAGPGACWGLSGVLERGACWGLPGGGNSVGSAALQRASVAQRACVRVARRWPVMAQDGSSWFVQVAFLARPGLVVVLAGSSSSPSKLCHGPPYLAPAFLPIELHRRRHDVRIRPLNPSQATLRSLLWIVYSLHSTALVFLVPSPLRSPAPDSLVPPSTRLLISGVAAAFTCTLRLFVSECEQLLSHSPPTLESTHLHHPPPAAHLRLGHDHSPAQPGPAQPQPKATSSSPYPYLA